MENLSISRFVRPQKDWIELLKKEQEDTEKDKEYAEERGRRQRTQVLK